MVVVLLLMRLIPYDVTSRGMDLISIIINAIVGIVTYVFISYKMNLLNDIIGEEYLNKIKRKLTFKK